MIPIRTPLEIEREALLERAEKLDKEVFFGGVKGENHELEIYRLVIDLSLFILKNSHWGY